MIKKLFLLMSLIVCSLSANAQYEEGQDFSWIENAPQKYDPATTKIIISATSPCNTDGEAFKDFIPRFRTDAKFRNERMRVTSEIAKSIASGWDGWKLIKACNRGTRRAGEFGTWYNVSADTVCFHSSEWNDTGDWGGSDSFFKFNRIDGKWYCTDIMMAG